MSTHTPGPWTIEEYGDDNAPALVIHKGTESRICFMATPGSHGDPNVIEADARLIAAAPDMLATLKAVTEFAAATLEDEPNHPAWDDVRKARAAIAAAEGHPITKGKGTT